MGVVDIPYKYFGLTPKTSKGIKKVNLDIFFFDLTVRKNLSNCHKKAVGTAF